MKQHGFTILAISALGAGISAATIPENAEKRATQIPKTKIDPAIFNQIVYYAGYEGGYFDAPCKNPPYSSVVQGYANANPSTGSDTSVTLFRRDSTKELVLAYPGSISPEDFINDASLTLTYYGGCPGCLVHTGFYNAWNSTRDDSQRIVDTALSAYPTYKFVIAGYSLGAAIASQAFAFFSSKGYKVAAAFTYGEPRGGNAAYANFIDKLSNTTLQTAGNYYRVTNAGDFVPKYPFQSSGYMHSMTEYWANYSPGGKQATAETSWRCYGQEPSDCNNSAGKFPLNADHAFYPGLNLSCGFF